MHSVLRGSLPVLALTGAAMIWGSSFPALKFAFLSWDPMVVIFGRMLVATLVFLPFFPGFCRLRFRKRDIGLMVVMALCEPCLYFLFEAKALVLTTASQAGMVASTMPLLVAVLAWLVLREAISARVLAGFVLAIVGVVWLSLAAGESEYAPNPLMGNFYELLAMSCAAGYTVTLRHLSGNYPPLFLTAVQAVVGALFFLPFLFLPGHPLPTGLAPVEPLLATIYLGVVVSGGAYTLFNYGVSRLSASRASAYVNLVPVFSLFFATLFLGETLNRPQMFASGLVLLGVVLSSSGGKRGGQEGEIPAVPAG